MIGQNEERYLELCERAVNEQDPEKLRKLIEEIVSCLAAKEELGAKQRELSFRT